MFVFLNGSIYAIKLILIVHIGGAIRLHRGNILVLISLILSKNFCNIGFIIGIDRYSKSTMKKKMNSENKDVFVL